MLYGACGTSWIMWCSGAFGSCHFAIADQWGPVTDWVWHPVVLIASVCHVVNSSWLLTPSSTCRMSHSGLLFVSVCTAGSDCGNLEHVDCNGAQYFDGQCQARYFTNNFSLNGYAHWLWQDLVHHTVSSTAWMLHVRQQGVHDICASSATKSQMTGAMRTL